MNNERKLFSDRNITHQVDKILRIAIRHDYLLVMSNMNFYYRNFRSGLAMLFGLFSRCGFLGQKAEANEKTEKQEQLLKAQFYVPKKALSFHF